MTRRLRVGVVVPGWSGPGDPPALPALEDLLGAAAREHDLRMVTIRHPARGAPYRDRAGIPVTPLGFGVRGGPLGRASAVAAGVAALWRLHAEAPFDVLHGFWADEPGMIATLAGRSLGRRAVVSVMGGELVGLADIGYGARLGRGGRVAAGTALRLADLVTVGSTTLFGQVAAVAPETSLRLLPLSVDLARFAPGDGGAVSPPRLLVVGSLTPVKDPVLALRAFARLPRTDVKLELVGDGPMRGDLERLARVLGVADRVRFPGPVPRDALPGLMRSASALLVTSRHEAQSMVAVEAAACGLPVVGVAVGVLPELARAGGAVIAADRRPASVAVAIGEALDPDRRVARAAAARAHAVHAWDARRAMDRLIRAWQVQPGNPDRP